MARAIVGRWGKNLAVRFPADIAASAGFSEGEQVDIAATDDAVLIRRLPAEISVETLFAGRSPEAWRALYRDAFEWGPDVGRERIDE